MTAPEDLDFGAFDIPCQPADSPLVEKFHDIRDAQSRDAVFAAALGDAETPDSSSESGSIAIIKVFG